MFVVSCSPVCMYKCLMLFLPMKRFPCCRVGRGGVQAYAILTHEPGTCVLCVRICTWVLCVRTCTCVLCVRVCTWVLCVRTCTCVLCLCICTCVLCAYVRESYVCVCTCVLGVRTCMTCVCTYVHECCVCECASMHRQNWFGNQWARRIQKQGCRLWSQQQFLYKIIHILIRTMTVYVPTEAR